MAKDDDELCTLPAEEALARLGSDLGRGLSAEEAARRRARYGANEIAAKHVSPLLRFFPYFWGQCPG
jgi:magnesium-transporting ATPase (P-type)